MTLSKELIKREVQILKDNSANVELPNGIRIGDLETKEEFDVIGQLIASEIHTIRQELDDAWAEHTTGKRSPAEWLADKRNTLRDWQLAGLALKTFTANAKSKGKANSKRKSILISCLIKHMTPEAIGSAFTDFELEFSGTAEAVLLNHTSRDKGWVAIDIPEQQLAA